jgi:ADP-ribose pyrophosphatase YjhB (NUDIX family)
MPVAVHLFLLRDEQILLLRRYNTGYEDGNYSVIAGHLDGNEEITQAMIREAREEALIELQPQEVKIIGVMHRKFEDGEAVNFFFATTTWQGVIQNGEPEKCDELAWYPLDQLPNNVVPYVRQALANYLQGTWFESYGWS